MQIKSADVNIFGVVKSALVCLALAKEEVSLTEHPEIWKLATVQMQPMF